MSGDAAGAVLYVYYKVDVAQHAATAPRVRALQTALLQAWPGLHCELLQRPDASAGSETWMETYRHVAGMRTELIDAIAAAASAAALPAPRHAESFIALR